MTHITEPKIDQRAEPDGRVPRRALFGGALAAAMTLAACEFPGQSPKEETAKTDSQEQKDDFSDAEILREQLNAIVGLARQASHEALARSGQGETPIAEFLPELVTANETTSLEIVPFEDGIVSVKVFDEVRIPGSDVTMYATLFIEYTGWENADLSTLTTDDMIDSIDSGALQIFAIESSDDDIVPCSKSEDGETSTTQVGTAEGDSTRPCIRASRVRVSVIEGATPGIIMQSLPNGDQGDPYDARSNAEVPDAMKDAVSSALVNANNLSGILANGGEKQLAV